jgi:hypothetical protein
MFKKPFTQSYNAPFEPGTIQDRFQMAKLNLITKKKKRKGAGYNMNYEQTIIIFLFKYQQINIWPFDTSVSRNNTLTEDQNQFQEKHFVLWPQYNHLLQSISMTLISDIQPMNLPSMLRFSFAILSNTSA